MIHFKKLIAYVGAVCLFFASIPAIAQPSWLGGYPKATPSFSDPYQENIKVSVSANQSGTAYFVTYFSQPSTAPSASQIVQYVRGTSPSDVKAKDSIVMASDSTDYSKQIMDVSKNDSGYKTYIVMKNSAGTFSPVALKTTRIRLFAKVKGAYKYLEYLPSGYNGTTTFPLLIFLHGLGERGSSVGSLEKLLVHGPPKHISNGTGYDFNEFIVISPQSGGQWNVTNLDGFLEGLKSSGLKIDCSRIYLTGLSMGGYGTWKYAINHPKKLAAIVPICGGADGFEALADDSLKRMPIWAFHDDPDGEVPTTKTTNLETSITQANGYTGKMRVTLFRNRDEDGNPVEKHSIWNSAYSEEPSPDSTAARGVIERPNAVPSGTTIYSWMLQHSISSPANVTPTANAGSDNSITLPTASTTLSGSGSDQDGTISSYAWTQQSGPNNANIQSESSASTLVSGMIEGVYTFRLTVTDDDAATGYDDVQITVLPANTTTWEFYLNTGGNAGTYGGKSWEQDKQTAPHSTYDTDYYSLTTGSSSSFAGTNNTGAPDEVLGSYRYNSNSHTTLKYEIPVPSASDYSISLFFARRENDSYTSGARRFNIIIEGSTVRTGYDVYDEAGDGASSYVYTTNVEDGYLDISLVAVAGSHAQINGIAVVKLNSDTDPPAPTDPISLAINTGGDNYTSGGITWELDKQIDPHPYLTSYNNYTTGSTSTFSGNNPTTAPDEVVGSYRYTGSINNTISYAIPVPGAGDYDLEFFFGRKSADTFVSGARRFDIKVEGSTIRAAYDIYDEAGTGASSYVYTATVVDDTLDISFVAVSGSTAQINAITVQGPVQSSAMMSTMTVAATEANQTMFYPNPAGNSFQIDFDPGVYQVTILDEQRNVYLDERFEVRKNETKTFDISNLPTNRVYFATISSKASKQTARLFKK